MKNMAKRAKQPSKSGVLGAKSDILGIKKYELTTKLERLNGSKCRYMQKKRTEKESVKAENNTFLLAFEPFFR